MGVTPKRTERKLSVEEAEQLLKNYRFSRMPIRGEIEFFLGALQEPYRSFATLRYRDGQTYEVIAYKLNYSPRTLFNFRKKVLKWWLGYLKGRPI